MGLNRLAIDEKEEMRRVILLKRKKKDVEYFVLEGKLKNSFWIG